MATKLKNKEKEKDTTAMALDFLNGFEEVDIVQAQGGRTESVPAVTITEKGRIVLSSATSKAVTESGATHGSLLSNPKVTNGLQMAIRFTKGVDTAVKAGNSMPITTNAKSGVVGLGVAATIRKCGHDFEKLGTQRLTIQEEGKNKAGNFCVTFSIPADLKPAVKAVRAPRKPKTAPASDAPAVPVTLTAGDVAQAPATA